VLRRFSHRLALAFCLVLVCAMGLTDLFLARALRRQFVEEMTESLLTQARLIAARASRGTEDLQAAAGLLSGSCACRVTFIGPDGAVLGDSSLDREAVRALENHKDRPEVREALQGRPGHSVRHSGTVHEGMLYAAAPMSGGGAACVAMSLKAVDRRVSGIRRAVVSITLTMALAALLAAVWLSRSISRPVAELSRAAERLAGGDYGARVRPGLSDEHGRLGDILNLLAERVRDAIGSLSREKAQLSGILANMVEGVVAVDGAGRILEMNPALCRLFGARREDCIGRPFLEALRHNTLDVLLQSVLKEGSPHRDEVRLLAPEEMSFEAQAVPLDGGGAVLVLHDITRLRRLEAVRKDFVANASHELRTPLASIKAFAETLRTGGLDDADNRMEFVEAIEKDAERMARLVDDLLDLSSVESGRRAPKLERVALAEALEEVCVSLRPLADRRRVRLELRVPPGLAVRADRDQLRQVLTNLLDNAVKFNREGGETAVSADAQAGRVRVSVRDTGPGIPEESLPRIFERFYRVDRARSRDLGGTGLGLSIVKHIVEAHGGSVGVESGLGKGSTFWFTLPD
jgi:two-component system phosphate regulon sensor histidine kinase PhoR